MDEHLKPLSRDERRVAVALFHVCYGTHYPQYSSREGEPLEFGAEGYRVLLDQFCNDGINACVALSRRHPLAFLPTIIKRRRRRKR